LAFSDVKRSVTLAANLTQKLSTFPFHSNFPITFAHSPHALERRHNFLTQSIFSAGI
jgi:hypothetical protein